MEFDKDVRDRFVKALEEDLYEKHKSFASNPLLLSIMLLTFENYAEIPEKLHLFYANAFETLYEKHDATKAGYRREIKSNLSFDNFRTVFSFFCFFTYGQGKTEFSRDELISILKKIAKKKIQFKASDYVYDLENSLCLLYKDGLNYRFAHRSFQEYFAAFFMKELSDENMKNMSFRLITQDSFRAANDNVFSMLYDMCEDRFEQNVLLPVLIEFEEERGEKEELYEYYFNKFVDSIFFDTGSENGEKTIRLWLRTTYHDDLTEFVYRTTRIYSRRNKPQKAQQKKESMKAEELLDYLQKNKGYEMEDKLTGAEIKEDETAYKIFKETWIGDSVNTASILRNTLQNKKEKTAIDLDALFD